MILVKTIAFFICLNFLTSAVADPGSGNFVGNAGEVVRIKERIFLRDLYEYGVHEDFYVGSEIDPDIEKYVLESNAFRSLLFLGIDSHLLMRKLTDLNVLWPKLGFYVFSAIDFYHWTIVPESLGKLNDSSPILNIPPSDQLPLANRFRHTIRISNPIGLPLWTLLSPEHRVALLIHEALYSLTTPVCDTKDNKSLCKQDPVFAREIVGTLFSRNSARNRLSWTMMNQFILPHNSENCQHRAGAELTLGSSSKVREASGPSISRLKNPYDLTQREEFIKSSCQSSGSTNSNVYLELRRFPYRVRSHLIPFDQFNQIYLTLTERAPAYTEILRFPLTEETCKGTIRNILSDWYDTDSGRFDLASSCQFRKL